MSQHTTAAADQADLQRLIEFARQRIVIAFYQSPTVETLQALAILATERIAQGRPLRGWSLIGSLSRTSVQCGLNEERFEAGLLFKKAENVSLRVAINMLPPPSTSIEAETQRRVFWVGSKRFLCHAATTSSAGC